VSKIKDKYCYQCVRVGVCKVQEAWRLLSSVQVQAIPQTGSDKIANTCSDFRPFPKRESIPTEEPNNCQRCGKCCSRNGDFWWDSEHPFIKALHNNLTTRGIECADENACLFYAMLEKEGKIVKVCMIEEFFGRQWKPQVCKDYPESGDKCFNEMEMAQ